MMRVSNRFVSSFWDSCDGVYDIFPISTVSSSSLWSVWEKLIMLRSLVLCTRVVLPRAVWIGLFRQRVLCVPMPLVLYRDAQYGQFV